LIAKHPVEVASVPQELDAAVVLPKPICPEATVGVALVNIDAATLLVAVVLERSSEKLPGLDPPGPSAMATFWVPDTGIACQYAPQATEADVPVFQHWPSVISSLLETCVVGDEATDVLCTSTLAFEVSPPLKVARAVKVCPSGHVLAVPTPLNCVHGTVLNAPPEPLTTQPVPSPPRSAVPVTAMLAVCCGVHQALFWSAAQE
jgi:hypothetical protein